MSRANRMQMIVALLASVGVIIFGSLDGWAWYFTAIAIIALSAYAFLVLYEQKAVDPKYIALVATMSAISAVSRAAVQGIPDVQPATFFVIMSGFCIGPAPGLAVGVLTALGSNLFLGEGGWTPWQMLAWGLVGLTAGWIRLVWPTLKIRWLVPFGFVWGYLFGWIMNTWSLLGQSNTGLHAYFALCLLSAPFDTNHALTTAALLAVAGPAVYRILERYRRKMRVTRLEDGGGSGEDERADGDFERDF